MDRIDPTLEQLKKDPKAARLLSDPEGLKTLLAAPETQKLMELLNRSAGPSLQAAAQAAAKGSPQDLMGIVNQVMQSKEGAAAVEGIQKKAEKQ